MSRGTANNTLQHCLKVQLRTIAKTVSHCLSLSNGSGNHTLLSLVVAKAMMRSTDHHPHKSTCYHRQRPGQHGLARLQAMGDRTTFRSHDPFPSAYINERLAHHLKLRRRLIRPPHLTTDPTAYTISNIHSMVPETFLHQPMRTGEGMSAPHRAICLMDHINRLQTTTAEAILRMKNHVRNMRMIAMMRVE